MTFLFLKTYLLLSLFDLTVILMLIVLGAHDRIDKFKRKISINQPKSGIGLIWVNHVSILRIWKLLNSRGFTRATVNRMFLHILYYISNVPWLTKGVLCQPKASGQPRIGLVDRMNHPHGRSRLVPVDRNYL